MRLQMGMALVCVVVPLVASAQVEVKTSTELTERMLFADDPTQWARPKLVVPPKFPESELARNATGYVDIDVTIDESGLVTQAKIAKSDPANPAFESAVMEVIKLWVFRPSLTEDCLPESKTANVRVWFEPKDGQGTVSVSKDVAPQGTSFAERRRLYKPLNQREAFAKHLRYPIDARKSGWEADVYAIARVDAKSGDVTEVTISKATVPGHASNKVRDVFVKPVKETMMAFKFEPAGEGARKVCVPIVFRLNG